MSNVTKKQHSDVEPYMNATDWEALGPMGKMYSATDVAFDNPDLEENYDGSEETREKAERPYQAHLTVKSSFHPLGNPNRTADMTDYEAAHSMWQHYYMTLMRSDNESVKLFAELAKAGNQKIRDAIEIESKSSGRSDAQVRSEILDARTANSSTDAANIAEEIISLQNARSGGGLADFTVVAPTTEEARIIRNMIDYSLTIMPPDSELQYQQIIRNPNELPKQQDIETVLNAIRPDPWAIVRKDGKKAISIITSFGLHNPAVDYIKSLDNSLSIVPGQNSLLWKTLINDKDRHFRIRADFEKPDSNKKYAPGAFQRNNEKVINEGNRTVVFWDQKDAIALSAIAYAARRGKLDAVFDSKGRELDLISVVDEAISANPTMAERGRMKTVSLFDIPANTPNGRLGLSLVRGYKASGISQEGIDALASTGSTINELVDMAKTKEGSQELLRTHRIGLNIIRQLADDRAMANARSAYERIINHCREHDVTIIGPESYPLNLLKNSKRLPPVMYIKGGNAEQFASISNSIAIMGDKPQLPQMAKKGAEMISNLDQKNITLIQMEKGGINSYVPKNASVLMLPSGHGHYGIKASLEWEANGKIQESQTKNGRYILNEDFDNGYATVIFETNGKQKTLASTNIPDIVKVGKNPFEEMTDDEKKIMKRYENSIDDLKKAAEKNETLILAAPVIEHRQKIMENNGIVVSVFPPEETTSSWSSEKMRVEGIPSNRTPATEAKTIDLAARIADDTIINQISKKSLMKEAIIANAESGKRVIVIQPEDDMDVFDEVSGNFTLMKEPANNLGAKMALGAEGENTIAKAFGNKPAVISTGPNLKVASEAIVKRVTQKDEKAKEAPRKAKVAGGDAR